MKKVIMAAVLLVSTVSVFAGEANKLKEKIGSASEWKTEKIENVMCTVSLEGSVTLIGVSVKVTCSATATTCKEAVTQATKCLEEVKNIVMY